MAFTVGRASNGGGKHNKEFSRKNFLILIHIQFVIINISGVEKDKSWRVSSKLWVLFSG